ncbi:MAG TPA: hypothetical protein VG371_01550 [Solirubrobacteraceae bacterium]|nr:hypothetical protein [Solirubrobacteraceae bacterium]
MCTPIGKASSGLENTAAVARSSSIDPRVITRFEDGAVIELPTDVDGDAARREVEQRVRGLLLTAG